MILITIQKDNDLELVEELLSTFEEYGIDSDSSHEEIYIQFESTKRAKEFMAYLSDNNIDVEVDWVEETTSDDKLLLYEEEYYPIRQEDVFPDKDSIRVTKF